MFLLGTLSFNVSNLFFFVKLEADLLYFLFFFYKCRCRLCLDLSCLFEVEGNYSQLFLFISTDKC